MRTFARLTVLALALVLGAPASGCDDDDASDDESSESGPDCDDAPRYADVEIFATCTTCHASTLMAADRNGALISVNFDTYAAAMTWGAKAVERVNAGAMPPPSSGLTVTQMETDELERWVLCGMPE